MNKIIFMNHILNLEKDTLARQVQVAQQVNESPGLTAEVQNYLSDLNLPSCFDNYFAKSKWKRLVKKAIEKANEEEIRESIKPYKKMKNINLEEEKFERKEYLTSLSLCKARTMFKHKYSMTEHVKMNFKNDRTYANSLWKCSECQNQDSEIHLLWWNIPEEMKRFQCNSCDSSYKYKKGLEAHKKEKHGVVDTQSIGSDSEGKFKCDVCSLSYKNKKGPNEHKQIKHEVNSYSCNK